MLSSEAWIPAYVVWNTWSSRLEHHVGNMGLRALGEWGIRRILYMYSYILVYMYQVCTYMHVGASVAEGHK